MKLKKIISKKTISLLVKSNEEAMKIWNKDFGNFITKDQNKGYHIDETKLHYLLVKPIKQIKPYIEAMITSEVLQHLKRNHQEYYSQVWSNIKQNKGNAEINIKQVEEKVPLLKPLNEMLGLYK
ncbi:hypothetical protein KY348_02555 [Candidatus Woesearchaeota archaeon]|nr:hypothetical protein [Candidatus Woesearchaeota archaeon]